jgi:hypothetical protein
MGGRRMRFQTRCGLLFVASSLAASPVVRAQDSVPAPPAGASFWRATAGVATVNWVTWAYNWYVQRWPWANVGTQSWAANLRHGFVWDNDCFLDNQLAHPYHGSLYHSSARAAGYRFWGSLPFVAAGSATWELFGENITASLNDLINTTLGGVAIGEVTYRLSSMLGSKHGARPSSVARELGAFALSPMGRTQTLLRLDRPDDIAPPANRVSSVSFGRRAGHPFFQLGVRYGSPFDAEAARPYDAFEFRLQVSPDSGGAVREVTITGLLARKQLRESARSGMVLGLFQHYDYEDHSAFELSGQSLSGALLYQRRLGERNRLQLGAHLEAVLLGAISSDQGFWWRRDYDLGPGAGARASAAWARDGLELLRVDARLVWLHSLHGSEGEHVARLLRLVAAVPIAGAFGVGGDVALATRHSRYPGSPSVTQRVPELRAYLSWAP